VLPLVARELDRCYFLTAALHLDVPLGAVQLNDEVVGLALVLLLSANLGAWRSTPTSSLSVISSQYRWAGSPSHHALRATM
jgi:hypothetical protein